MSGIDPSARVHDGAKIADGVTVGPFCVVGPNVTIAAGTKLLSHVSIAGHTSVGSNCTIHPFASLGSPPQDLSYRDEPTTLEIGDNCTIRESVTMNLGTIKGGGKTRVGKRGFFMAYSHVGHDCIVGDDAIFANCATLGGHCEIGDFVYFGGLSAAHQFLRVGSQAMIGGVSGLRGDVIPYGLVNGQDAMLDGLNLIGMRRRKFTRERLQRVRHFYGELFHGPGVFAERLERVRLMTAEDPAIGEIVTFIDGLKKRPLCMPNMSGARS